MASKKREGASDTTQRKKKRKTSGSPGHSEIEKKLLQLFLRKNGGITNELIAEELKEHSLEARRDVINSLLNVGKLRLMTEGGKFIYKMVAENVLNKLRGLPGPDCLIYHLIEGSSNKGIWIRDLRRSSNLQQPQIAKILKTLMSRKLIKCERSIAGKNKKVYMLYDLEPAKEVTGGAWYSSNGEFDFEFISALYDTCIRCFKVHKKATAEDVAKFVREGGFFTVTCKTEDIAQILLSMLYDGVIERLSETEAEAFSFSSSSSSSSSSNTSNSHSRIAQKSTCYQLTKAGHPSSSFTSMPCSNCPVADSCFEGSTISPETSMSPYHSPKPLEIISSGHSQHSWNAVKYLR